MSRNDYVTLQLDDVSEQVRRIADSIEVRYYMHSSATEVILEVAHLPDCFVKLSDHALKALDMKGMVEKAVYNFKEQQKKKKLMDDSRFAKIIAIVDAHLDNNVSEEYKQQPLAQDWARVSKVFEEGGEAIDDLIGYTGQNPRKGTYSTQGKMLKELADTALTAIYGIQHFTKDATETLSILHDTAEYHADRLGLDVQNES